MAKNIVLLSDGTGNSAAKLFRTNVWRTYEALDLSGADQIAFYHDGVGTSPFAVLAAIQGTFGWGLKRNVLDLYAYLCEHYTPGDRLYAFGFSRGAFTIRVLVGLVAHQGILQGAPVRDLPRLAKWAYRAYRRTYTQTGPHLRWLRAVRDWLLHGIETAVLGQPKYRTIKRQHLHPGDFTFVGLWDTVDAYGLPIDELTDGIDRWVWPLSIPTKVPSEIIGKGCHALALDDERETYHPVLWDERTETRHQATHIDQERITQVWFAGMHANVGGGYADDRLAHVSFKWMTGEAVKRGLKVLDTRLADTSAQVDTEGRVYDSRSGFGGYYRYCPRTVMIGSYGPPSPPLASRYKIHESVFQRIHNEQGYAPIVLPQQYAVVDTGGAIENVSGPEPTGALRAHRMEEQERCWDLVFWKRLTYFATIAATIFLALRPLGVGFDPEGVPNTGIALSGLVGLIGGFLPRFAAPAVSYFKRYPHELFLGAALILGLMAVGERLQNSIAAHMRTGWNPRPATPGAETIGQTLLRWIAHKSVQWLRTCHLYRGVSSLLSRIAVPFLFGMGVLLLIAVLLNRAVFEIQSGGGRFCSSGPQPQLDFAPNEFCHATGFQVTRSHRYRVHVTLPANRGMWRDAEIPVTSPAGIALAGGGLPFRQFLLYLGALPARRIFRADVFTPIGRVGQDGADHYVLKNACTTITARKDGEMFLFVNDVILPVLRRTKSFPWITPEWDAYYSNNSGEKASVTIESVPESDKGGQPDCPADVGTE